MGAQCSLNIHKPSPPVLILFLQKHGFVWGHYWIFMGVGQTPPEGGHMLRLPWVVFAARGCYWTPSFPHLCLEQKIYGKSSLLLAYEVYVEGQCGIKGSHLSDPIICIPRNQRRTAPGRDWPKHLYIRGIQGPDVDLADNVTAATPTTTTVIGCWLGYSRLLEYQDCAHQGQTD